MEGSTYIHFFSNQETHVHAHISTTFCQDVQLKAEAQLPMYLLKLHPKTPLSNLMNEVREK